MEITPGELADKLSILHLKLLYCKDDSHKKSIQSQFSEAFFKWDSLMGESKDYEVWHWFFRLAQVNSDIWFLETGLRDLPEDEGIRNYEEIGRRAMKIRNINRERVALRNRINEHFGKPKEVKINHASE